METKTKKKYIIKRSVVGQFPVQRTLKRLIKYSRMGYKTAFYSVHGQLYPVKTNSSRYRLFHKNNICVFCGRVGNVLYLEQRKESLKNSNKYFFNLYCQEDNNLILMTKDHIYPSSKGGKNCMSNYQTLCQECNCKKGDKLMSVRMKCKKKAVMKLHFQSPLPEKKFLDKLKRILHNFARFTIYINL